MVEKGKPRKKYRNFNYFLETKVGYQFPFRNSDLCGNRFRGS